MKIAAFASGNGSNLTALVENGIEIDLVICNKPDAYVITRANNHNLDCVVIPTKGRDQVEFETEMLAVLEKYNIELILLAGYMRMVGATLLNEYEGNIINIHPSLLPSFKGAHAISDAYNYGVCVSGVTVHFIDSEMDAGTIISQVPVLIDDSDSLEQFEQNIHNAEYQVFSSAVKKVIKERNEKSIS
ncbi:phosphoribosylglycinamide formyltransferase [Mollicutes bacterium LVI A0078]|nr:phosphoribosylglycinamide formyltransferase [Mollicutes bacterium LVI A0075]WOO91522.1 phosphoribosylglycinamide formyltransferase [Mollicutes bacterium LVI A0078]